MELRKTGIAGTMESSDIMITLEPRTDEGIDIDLNSTVEKQFGQEIRRVIRETLLKMEIQNAQVVAVDKGALDCAIRARVKTAACRATGQENGFVWEVHN